MKKTPIDKLDVAIQKVLSEYGEETNKNVTELAKKFAQKGAKAVKDSAKAKFGGSGKYANGWTYTVETGRLSAQGAIYNKAAPGLPHLLEYGHAKRGGGRVPGKAHIAPVEEKLVEEFRKAVEHDL